MQSRSKFGLLRQAQSPFFIQQTVQRDDLLMQTLRNSNQKNHVIGRITQSGFKLFECGDRLFQR